MELTNLSLGLCKKNKSLLQSLSPEAARWYFYSLKLCEYKRLVIRYRNIKNVKAALDTAIPYVERNISEYDSEPYYLNTPAGTVDLRKGIDGMKAHDPADYITHVTAVSPGERGAALWSDMLDKTFCGDEQLIEFVQRVMGMAAIGKVFSEILVIAYGNGRNGKSTFLNTISKVLGNYSGSISSDVFSVECHRNVSPEKAELLGKRLVIAAEFEEGEYLNESFVKQICSTDPIRAEKKYKDPFDFIPSHTTIMHTNHLPLVKSRDNGIWRRLVLIPFNAEFNEGIDIKDYASFLVDNAGEAVMSWIIEGAKKFIADGCKLNKPTFVDMLCDGYRGDNNWMKSFIDECCSVGPDHKVMSGELYKAYREYCLSNKELVQGTTAFYTALSQEGFTKRKTNKGMVVYGLSLRNN